MFVAFGILRALGMSHVSICGLACSTKCFYIISLTAPFSEGEGEGGVIEHKMCVSIFSTAFVETFFFILRRNEQDVNKNV